MGYSWNQPIFGGFTNPTKTTSEPSASQELAFAAIDFEGRASAIQSDYEAASAEVDKKFFEISVQVEEMSAGVLSRIGEYTDRGQASVDTLNDDMRKSLTGIQHAQNLQVVQAASQLDSMISSGQFGGNVYRSQQAYSMNISSIIASSMKVVADITMQYRTAALNLQSTYDAGALQGYISNAATTMQLTSDLAKSHAMVHVDMASTKNQNLNTVMQLQVTYESTNNRIRADVSMTKLQAQAQLMMAKWANDASMQETRLRVDAQDRATEASTALGYAELEVQKTQNAEQLKIATESASKNDAIIRQMLEDNARRMEQDTADIIGDHKDVKIGGSSGSSISDTSAFNATTWFYNDFSYA